MFSIVIKFMFCHNWTIIMKRVSTWRQYTNRWLKRMVVISESKTKFKCEIEIWCQTFFWLISIFSTKSHLNNSMSLRQNVKSNIAETNLPQFIKTCGCFFCRTLKQKMTNRESVWMSWLNNAKSGRKTNCQSVRPIEWKDIC